jgi:hypothetical protein
MHLRQMHPGEVEETDVALDTLECPEIGSNSAPDLIGAPSGGLLTTDNRVELANEINDSANRLKITNPNNSSSDVQNVLIAAYCHVVARKPGLLLPKNGAACASSTVSWNGRLRQS